MFVSLSSIAAREPRWLPGPVFLVLFWGGVLVPLLTGPAAAGDVALLNCDVDADGSRDISDAVSLLHWLETDEHPPRPLGPCGGEPASIQNGDADGDGTVDVSDAASFLAWLLLEGPAPVTACGSIEESEDDADGTPYDGAPAFDFSDAFLLANGIDPTRIVDRLAGQDERSVLDASPHSDFRDVRIVETTGGFDHSGNLLYYVVTGKVMPSTFTSDEAGARARELADSFHAFLFPKAAGDPLGPAPPNRRQDNIFDTRNGYFSNNPLGLWLLTFVSYTEKALTTEEGQEALADLAARNGRDLDGTPVIKTVSELEKLEHAGLVEFRSRAPDGSQGFPWVL